MSAVRNPAAEKGPAQFCKDCCKSVFTLMHVFSRTKKAPPFCFSFFLMMWGVWWLDWYGYVDTSRGWVLNLDSLSRAVSSPTGRGPETSTTRGGADTSATPNAAAPTSGAYSSNNQLITSAILHWFVPYSGFLRTCLIGSMLIIFGYTYESLIGTSTFLKRFLGLHAAMVAFQSYFRLTDFELSVTPEGGASPIPILRGIEPTLVCLQCLYHFQNPKIAPSQIRDEFLQMQTFTVEPRWHGWLLLMLLLFTAQWPLTLGKYTLGLVLGVVYVIRYPSTWPLTRTLFQKERTFLLMLALQTASLVYLPITAQRLPDTSAAPIASVVEATLRSPHLSYLSLGSYAEPMPQAYFLIQFSLGFIPLAITLVQRFPCIKGMYALICVLLAMYIMNTSSWNYVNTGFVGLLYAAYGFFTC
ncbi:unnamed protein product [Amoebophrya sp. A120]|nr:unnamed protein product [Amoebophrya sp. A120]|eukprot:GSA120T00023015001.1